MADLEKVSINLGPVDLGQIDLLVDQGYYNNRTDFIRIAIKSQLDSHSSVIKELKEKKYFVVGVLEFSREKLEEAERDGLLLDINLIGGLIVANDITIDLARKTFGKVRVFGIIRAPEEVKTYLRSLHSRS
ncbi:CopG family transcriptional regulator [Paenibacillus sp. MMS18-CY102]|uniref:CopG family transcriptional regulator n=1 Tax=Paenibacillus sp. MMS18-CY102 TaxID=2682849 RepID=UPI001365FC64|nr:CopG family transcriptional regulator [Paenibacillus sp. MMS18-CY102]MWC30656.1 CopG family transcriptional regulator [Paenibacillus sp. MMS18-CY102]